MKNRFENWGFQLNRPLVISGPCSVESEEQVMQVAEALKNSDVDILRGGIWKPRTRPNSFEGNGEKALPWLKRAGNAINKPVAVEVATPKHVESCLKEGIDYLWIGARTTVNPFAVQEIADALKGVDIPVFVKNPINPDLKLWLGAIERIEGAGIQKIGAIHRGFSHFTESNLRNIPFWPIAIDFRKERPEIPLVNDPSHIAGKRDFVFDVAQQALDLGFDGLMIETHCNPDEAWSDSAQQVTPEAFTKMTVDFKQRTPEIHDEDIEQLRDALHQLDDIIVDIISERMGVAREIGKLKKAQNIAIYQPKQFKSAIEYQLQNADDLQLSKEFITNLFTAIHNESVHQQGEIYHGKQFADFDED